MSNQKGFPTKAVANKFIDLAKEHGEKMTPMKLQKLVYFAHGWYLALTGGKPLIDEKIEAWAYGPVVPSLYHEFKSFGSSKIDRYAMDFDIENDFKLIAPKLPTDKELEDFLKKIWNVYGEFTGIQLSNMTHLPNTPWKKVWGEDGVPVNTDISDEIIKEHFSNLARV